MKKILLLTLTMLIAIFAGCSGKNTGGDIPVNVMIPVGTPQIALIKMIKEEPEFEGYDVTYSFPNSNDLLASVFMNGEAQIIIAPSNLGAIIYNKGVDYRLHGVIIWGSLYLAGEEEVSSISDLSGKEIYSIGKGLTTDILLNYLLKANGVEDVDIRYASSVSELVPLFLSGQVRISLMPEPSLSAVLANKPETFIVMDFRKEWQKVTGLDSGYPQAAVFVNEGFTEKNAGFVDEFIQACKDAADWVNENPDQAGEYYAGIFTGLAPETVSSSIPGSNILFRGAAEAKESLIYYYGILYDADPANIGGAMPDDAFYYGK